MLDLLKHTEMCYLKTVNITDVVTGVTVPG